MRIEDLDSAHHVTNIADIEVVLNKRHRAGINSFWLADGAGTFPAINIMVNGDLAYVHYFPNDNHPGFASVGNLPGLRVGEFSEFFPEQSNDSFDIMNEAVIPFSDALKVAQEFASSPTMPKCIGWNSLVEGE